MQKTCLSPNTWFDLDVWRLSCLCVIVCEKWENVNLGKDIIKLKINLKPLPPPSYYFRIYLIAQRVIFIFSYLFISGEIPGFWNFCSQWEWGPILFTFSTNKESIKNFFGKTGPNLSATVQVLLLRSHAAASTSCSVCIFWNFQLLVPVLGRHWAPFCLGRSLRPAHAPPRIVLPMSPPRALSAFAPPVLIEGTSFYHKWCQQLGKLSKYQAGLGKAEGLQQPYKIFLFTDSKSMSTFLLWLLTGAKIRSY